MSNNTNIEVTKTNSDCAQYTGIVTIASYLGDRLIQKETQHNAGLKTLFEFISSCLQGNWHTARDTRPCKVVLLKADENERFERDENDRSTPSIPTNSDAKNARTGEHYWSSEYAVCSPIMFDTAVVGETATDGTSSSATYHFRVPFLNLVSGSAIKKLMLLPSVATDYTSTACAYMVLDNEITVPDTGANFTVIIDWKLIFTNNTNNSTN